MVSVVKALLVARDETRNSKNPRKNCLKYSAHEKSVSNFSFLIVKITEYYEWQLQNGSLFLEIS